MTNNNDIEILPEWNDILTSVGELTLCIGPMFAGKTTYLLNLIKKLNNEFKDFLIVKPILDVRYGVNQEIISHNNETYPCYTVSHLADIKTVDLKRYMLIEEGQFFPDLYEYVERWLEEGRYIFVAGLIGDSEQRHFGDMTELMPLAEDIIFLRAKCSCGKSASFTSLCQKKGEKQILIGGAELYKPTCRECYNKNYDLTH